VRDPENATQVVFEVLEHLSTGKLKPILFDKEYNGLETVSQALQDLEGRLTWGKGVIRIKQVEDQSCKRESKL
jgi:NADPH2:quinone reductase